MALPAPAQAPAMEAAEVLQSRAEVKERAVAVPTELMATQTREDLVATEQEEALPAEQAEQ